jgi:hypothetical protein
MLKKEKTTAVILKFDDQPTSDIREFIRSHGLRFNRFRKEWYGNIPNTRLEDLKNSLGKIKYNLEIIDDLN